MLTTQTNNVRMLWWFPYDHVCGRRRVSVSSFKGAHYVNVREYYLKDGQEQPGAKGLSMSAAQWAVCAARVGDVTAALDRAQAGG